MHRPEHLILVAGTGTEVGKTWVATRLASALVARGVRVGARKPAQSFEPGTGPTDADLLAAATGERPTDVCPDHRWYERAMAPPMAAEALGRPVPTIDELANEVVWPDGCELGLVEAAGGVRSPLAVDGDAVALAVRLRPDAVVLVADAGLGTIDAVRSGLAALDGWPVVVLLNRFDERDELHVRNQRWLAERDGADVEVDVAVTAARHPRWCRPRA